MKDNLYFQCLQLCSGHYLCANYPDNWNELTENAQLEFIGDNLWEPMENETPELVRNAINSAAKVTCEFIEDLNQAPLSSTTEKQEQKDQIEVSWHILDVQSVAQEKFNKNISDEDAYAVLEFALNSHDACIGINWDVLYCAIETLEESGDITLLEDLNK